MNRAHAVSNPIVGGFDCRWSWFAHPRGGTSVDANHIWLLRADAGALTNLKYLLDSLPTLYELKTDYPITFILALAVVRLLWRKFTPLPAWAKGLSSGERKLAHRTEQLLYLCLFLIPLTGLALLFGSGEEWDISKRGEWESPWEFASDDVLLVAHIGAQLLFYVAFALHLGLVLKHQLITRDGLLWRMT